MRERVVFLQNACCIVRKNIIPLLGYLEKVGIQRLKMGEFVNKFLRGLDVEKQDIGYVLMKYPELSGFKLEGTEMGRPLKELVEFPNISLTVLNQEFNRGTRDCNIRGLGVRYLSFLIVAIKDLKKDC
ncbi:hypothetical protein HanRHA438_Chr16g0772971 [Helianthus annuus]|nr:hypothetical protein HanRHA438_Chr16g0772971 [Helianthus annuus]